MVGVDVCGKQGGGGYEQRGRGGKGRRKRRG